jgi:hypothetical protein
VAAVAATAVVVLLGVLRAPTQQADLTLESAGAASAGAFTPDFRAGATPSAGAALPAGVVDTGAVSGATEGIYRAVKGGSPCDRDGLSAFFKENPPIADLWVRAVAADPTLATAEAFKSVTATTLPGYIGALTPVLLRVDTHVTAYSMASGAATARQSVLQAGTAVLIDERGLPRLRCYGGSPLASPARNAPTASQAGDPWPGFDLGAAVVMTPAPNALRQFGLADPTGTTFRRPAGSVGPQDIDQVPQTALVEGTYAVQGTQVGCEGLKSCDDVKSLTLGIQLKGCSATQCTISAPTRYWIGEFPFTAADGKWSGTGPTGLEQANTCDGVLNPTTAVDLALTPREVAVDANGIWRANSLTGTVKRYNGAFQGCHSGSRSWSVTAKRTVDQ